MGAILVEGRIPGNDNCHLIVQRRQVGEIKLVDSRKKNGGGNTINMVAGQPGDYRGPRGGGGVGGVTMGGVGGGGLQRTDMDWFHGGNECPRVLKWASCRQEKKTKYIKKREGYALQAVANTSLRRAQSTTHKERRKGMG